MKTKGWLIDIQNFSVNDGDGIRTVVFFAGCRLRCQWCCNPESFTNFNKVVHDARSCIACGRCVEVCPYGVGINLNDPMERLTCTNCGICVEACPTHSRKNMIMVIEAQEVIKRIERQMLFFHASNGGVTYSGGEATAQPNFLRVLTNAVYDLGLHQAIETSGYFNYDQLADIFEKLDLVFVDIKLFDDGEHQRYTGMSNELILRNIKRLSDAGKDMVIRIPVIKGVNATPETISSIARFTADTLRNPKLELLPYHKFGSQKYESLGLPQPPGEFATPTAEEMTLLTDLVRREGVEVVSYR